MTKIHALLSLAGIAMLGACVDQNPVEIRKDGDSFPAVATWTAAMSPVGTNTVRGNLTVKQSLGYHMTTTFTVTGTPNAAYQWRIFRGSCSETVAAANVRAPGLWVFATVQAYPDIVLDASGTATVSPAIAGTLDSLTAYSVRIRPSQASTTFNGTSPLACGDLQRGPAS